MTALWTNQTKDVLVVGGLLISAALAFQDSKFKQNRTKYGVLAGIAVAGAALALPTKEDEAAERAATPVLSYVPNPTTNVFRNFAAQMNVR